MSLYIIALSSQGKGSKNAMNWGTFESVRTQECCTNWLDVSFVNLALVRVAKKPHYALRLMYIHEELNDLPVLQFFPVFPAGHVHLPVSGSHLPSQSQTSRHFKPKRSGGHSKNPNMPCKGNFPLPCIDCASENDTCAITRMCTQRK